MSHSGELQKCVIYYFVNSVKGSISDFLTEFMILSVVLIEMRNWRTETFAFHHGICMCTVSSKKILSVKKCSCMCIQHL